MSGRIAKPALVLIAMFNCNFTGSCATHKLDATKSIEYFSLYDPARGFCSNPEPIHDLAECRGQCYSKAAFSPGRPYVSSPGGLRKFLSFFRFTLDLEL